MKKFEVFRRTSVMRQEEAETIADLMARLQEGDEVCVYKFDGNYRHWFATPTGFVIIEPECLWFEAFNGDSHVLGRVPGFLTSWYMSDGGVFIEEFHEYYFSSFQGEKRKIAKEEYDMHCLDYYNRPEKPRITGHDRALCADDKLFYSGECHGSSVQVVQGLGIFFTRGMEIWFVARKDLSGQV